MEIRVLLETSVCTVEVVTAGLGLLVVEGCLLVVGVCVEVGEVLVGLLEGVTVDVLVVTVVSPRVVATVVDFDGTEDAGVVCSVLGTMGVVSI